MPAVLDDPTAAVIYRNTGDRAYETTFSPLPTEITPRQVTLRDRITTATLVPFSSPDQVPIKLTAYLCELLNREIEKGDTYPMINPLPLASFGPYWFANFGAIMMLGHINSTEEVRQMEEDGKDWEKECLGSFYVKPNYPGRSSHVCNGGFLVTDAARNRGVGRLMGEGYLEWAPKLGYTYSVFNLVYETNVASLRIWDALGFKRIGRVKGCGNLKSYPDTLIDAIVFGRELGTEGEDYVSEERFDKIRFYLKTGTYPNGSDRAEKSRLRSAATHYRLVPGDGGPEAEEKLMLKGKEVISDPHKQYEIARAVHGESHGGINKTTATIAERFHWVRIKETVSLAIRNCGVCQENAPKPPATNAESSNGVKRTATGEVKAGARPPRNQRTSPTASSADGHANAGQSQRNGEAHFNHQTSQADSQTQHSAPVATMSGYEYDGPLDPRLMNNIDAYSSEMHTSRAAYEVPDDYEQHAGAQNMQSPDSDREANDRLQRDLQAQLSQEYPGGSG